MLGYRKRQDLCIKSFSLKESQNIPSISELLRSIEEVRNLCNKHENEICVLKNENKKLITSNRHLRQENKLLNQENKILKKENQELKEEITSLKHRNITTGTGHSKIKNTPSLMYTKIEVTRLLLTYLGIILKTQP